ncbi:MAG: hypothetical protein M1834_000671 [Cirrosporium novae-zelandiae]|nr:MAG: hypothetical protein M1834_000671 [Cirrosporium novae-zelandiae]
MAPAKLFEEDRPRVIEMSAEERKKNSYNVSTLQKALEAMHQDGFVVLKSVVDVSHVNDLNRFMGAETPDILKDKRYFNHGVRYSKCVEYSYLGSKPIWNFTTGNNALANTGGLRQPVHKDITFFNPQCPFYFIANIPLCDFTEENGATEFWLGSHLHTTGYDQIIATPELTTGKVRLGEPTCNVRPEVVEARRGVRPPVRGICSKGDITIRDLRLWHAGMPNESDADRIMIAIGYQAPWFPNYAQQLKIPKSQCNYFMAASGQPVEVRAKLLPDEEVERERHQDDFNFRPS